MEKWNEEGEELAAVELAFVAQLALTEEGEGVGRREHGCVPPRLSYCVAQGSESG